MAPSEPVHGFLNIDKPPDITSHDVVARVRRLAGQRRVGHAGTLDPAATGVLVVALGGATRLIEYVQDETLKRYHAVVRLGVTTATDDAEGEILEQHPAPELTPAAIDTVLDRFRGLIWQAPPMYAALHHQGHRLYELARAGVTVDLPPRQVLVERLEVLAYQPPLVTLDIVCGKGTYIRALARDLGAVLGCGAHLALLRRTAVGAFRIETAVPLTADQDGARVRWLSDLSALQSALLPPDTAVADWARVDLDSDQTTQVHNGRTIELPAMCADRVRAHAPDGVLIALLRRSGDVWQPMKVFDWR